MLSKFKIFFFLTTLLFSAILRGQNIDIRILKSINKPCNPPADKFWHIVSDTKTTVAIATPLTMFATGLAIHSNDLQRNSYFSCTSIFLAAGLSSTLKIIFRRHRPYFTYSDIIVKKSNSGKYSFPSGHTTMAFATATALSLSFPKWYVVVPSYGYAAAVAFSRMYLGVHYPTDILGGMILGIGTSFLVFKSEKCLLKK